MAAISSLQSASAGLLAGLVNAADQSPAVAAKLLKKATDADKDLVNTLLPVPPPPGSVDIRA